MANRRNRRPNLDTPTEVVDESRRARPGYHSNTTSPYAFMGANDPRAGPPMLQFGEYGELTMRTIAQAGLTGEARKRAIEMMKVQAAYLEIYHSLDYPNDPEGHVVDLSGIHMTQPKIAIAWTLALLGYRPSGRKYIKKRELSAPGVAQGAYTWVDARAAEDAALDLLPEHKAADYKLPPDTRRLAAIRDGDPGQQLRSPWSVIPTVTEEFIDRNAPECLRRPREASDE